MPTNARRGRAQAALLPHLAALTLWAITPAHAQKGVLPTTIIVGGAPMVSDRDIIENLGHSGDHHIFMALLHEAGLANALRQHGPFTVFAPTDAAFATLPPDSLDALRRPENKAALVKLLQAHILPGDYSTARMRFLMRNNKGLAQLDTADEGKVSIGTNGPTNLAIHDEKGTVTDIILYDVKQANGVVFVIDRVLAPD